MTTVLVDTNVLIALVDRSDALHARATKDLARLARADLRVSSAALVEATFALPREDQRARLALLLERLPISPAVNDDEARVRREVFGWLARYAEHAPDYADAELCVAAGRDPRLRIWTYDSEFKRVWRTPNGRRLPVVGR